MNAVNKNDIKITELRLELNSIQNVAKLKHVVIPTVVRCDNQESM